MPNFKQRSQQLELMDDLSIPAEEMEATLRELEFINRWLGGFQVSWEGINCLLPDGTRQVSLLDVGTGAGDLPRNLVEQFFRKGIDCHITAIDINAHTIEYSKRHNPENNRIQFEVADIFDLPDFPQFDIVHAALFLHHFPKEQAVSVLRKMLSLSRWGVVINDLQRHSLAYYSIRLLTQGLSRSRLIRNDAPLSVLRAFSRDDLHELAKQSGAKKWEIHWRWAFRWSMVLDSGNQGSCLGFRPRRSHTIFPGATSLGKGQDTKITLKG